MRDPIHSDEGAVERLPRQSMPSFAQIMLPVLAVVSGGLLFLATPELIGASDLWDYAKAGLLAFGGGFVAYGVNSFAVQHGAPLAAIGSRTAMAASVLSIVAVGIGLSLSTFGGRTLREVVTSGSRATAKSSPKPSRQQPPMPARQRPCCPACGERRRYFELYLRGLGGLGASSSSAS